MIVLFQRMEEGGGENPWYREAAQFVLGSVQNVWVGVYPS